MFGPFSFDGDQMHGAIPVPALSIRTRLTVDAEDILNPVITAAQGEAMLRLQTLSREELLNGSVLIFEDYQRAWEDCPLNRPDWPVIETADTVWNYLEVTEVFVPLHFDVSDRFFFFMCRCPWEDEHGMEVLFRNGVIEQIGYICDLSYNQGWFIDYLQMAPEDVRRRRNEPELSPVPFGPDAPVKPPEVQLELF